MVLLLHVQHALLQQRFFECKFEETELLSSVKDKIHRMTGTLPQHQVLKLQIEEGKTINLGDDSSCLSNYGAKNGMEIHVDDTNPLSIAREAGLSDLTQIEKYVMSDEAYDQVNGSVRQFLRECFNNNPEFRRQVLEARQQRQQEAAAEKEAFRKIEVGMRCRVSGKWHGEVAFKGPVPSLGKCPMIGIALDEPLGDSDGTHGGVKYFDVKMKYGIFLKPSAAEVGDFPEQGLDDSSLSDL